MRGEGQVRGKNAAENPAPRETALETPVSFTAKLKKKNAEKRRVADLSRSNDHQGPRGLRTLLALLH